MKFTEATQDYEAWLGRHLQIIPEDLRLKHRKMCSGPFPFLRATFYRWAQTWQAICGEAGRAPEVLAVGDLHIENFGTWRDSEGRLIWGVNDFDEAWRLPYTSDLIRLTTSALLARMSLEPRAAVASILKGYVDGLTAGGRPFALAEHHPTLHAMALQRLHDAPKYWAKLHALPDSPQPPPDGAQKGIERLMPERDLPMRIVHRIAGLGSLGRERYVGLAQWRGGSVAREAKALAPSACVWAERSKGDGPILYGRILETAVRCGDPFLRLQKRWIVRRLAPDCSRIELTGLPNTKAELRLLHAMGFETANVHVGGIDPEVLIRDLRKRKSDWLYRAAHRMEAALLGDFEAFAKR